MDIAYENDFHEKLYTHLNRSNIEQVKQTWAAFIREHPVYEKYTENWLASRKEKTTSPLELALPWINFPTIDYLNAHLGLRDNVFEYGMGGSTIYFAKRCHRVISVEHDKKWFTFAKEVIENHTGPLGKRLIRYGKFQARPELHLIEPVAGEGAGAWDSGAKGFDNKSFREYAEVIRKWPQGHFNCVVVDGRARVACLRTAIPYVAPGGFIVMDNSDYQRYQPGINELRSSHLRGWTEIPLLGPGPCSNCIGWKSTIFKRPAN